MRAFGASLSCDVAPLKSETCTGNADAQRVAASTRTRGVTHYTRRLGYFHLRMSERFSGDNGGAFLVVSPRVQTWLS